MQQSSPGRRGRVLIIAGSDPSGGAGLQADIKTATALGAYAAAAVTALTVQDTRRVHSVHGLDPVLVAEQAGAVLEDIGADAIKIGMLGSADIVHTVAELLSTHAASIPIVLDPVLAATSGDALAGPATKAAMIERLMPLAFLVTPNRGEAEQLCGLPVADPADQEAAGKALIALGAKAALVKGGHVSGETVCDVLVEGAGPNERIRRYTHPRLRSTSTHGTGCTLSTAIACRLAQGWSLQDAVADGIEFVRRAIETAPGLGSGAGPLNHAWPLEARARAEGQSEPV